MSGQPLKFDEAPAVPPMLPGQSDPKKQKPPYPILASALMDGEVVPFLGAGVNSGVFPTGGALSRSLARECSFPSERDNDLEDLAKVSSYFVEVGSRIYLRRYLRKTFCTDIQDKPTTREQPIDNVHDYLAYLAGRAKPSLIVTTNYDDLTEAAFRKAGRPFDLVIHPTDRDEWKAAVLWWEDLGTDKVADAAKRFKAVDPSKLYINLDKKTVIYKMHGTVHRQRRGLDSYVITEDDYIEFLARMTTQTAVPAHFIRHFQSRRFLFLGYSLRDWNFRVVLRNLRAALPANKTEQHDFQELYEDLAKINPSLAHSLKRKVITPAQAVKMLEIHEQHLAGTNVDTLADYSDDDEDDSAINTSGPGRSWAVQYGPDAHEHTLWNGRGVEIFDVRIDEFVRHLHTATQEEIKERTGPGGNRNGE